MVRKLNLWFGGLTVGVQFCCNNPALKVLVSRCRLAPSEREGERVGGERGRESCPPLVLSLLPFLMSASPALSLAKPSLASRSPLFPTLFASLTHTLIYSLWLSLLTLIFKHIFFFLLLLYSNTFADTLTTLETDLSDLSSVFREIKFSARVSVSTRKQIGILVSDFSSSNRNSVVLLRRNYPSDHRIRIPLKVKQNHLSISS